MRYGFYLPTRGPTATRDGILALAREGERLGLHSTMVADHIVFPVESQSIYPYTLDGKHPSIGDALDAFSILGLVAGATERLRLVTSVLVLPYRNPILTAKMAASLRRPFRRSPHVGCWRGLAEGGIRGAEQPRLRGTGRGDRRVDRDTQAALVVLAGEFRRPVLPLLRNPLRTISGAATAPADLGRRAFPCRAATHGAVWRRLAPSRSSRGLAAAAAGDAHPSRYVEAPDRSRRAGLFGADDLL
jgi:Luciferase-like monooxygenase